VINAYALFLGGSLFLGGRGGDISDYQRLFITGLFIFTGASRRQYIPWRAGSDQSCGPASREGLTADHRGRIRLTIFNGGGYEVG
jgi:hypothetical protein